MNRRLPVYYWDSSVFIMVLEGCTDAGPGVIEAARKLITRMEDGKVVIVSSIIVVTEVLPHKRSREQFDLFYRWLQWPNLHLRDVDHAVAAEAARLRSECLSASPVVKLKTPDALHIATALLYKPLAEVHAKDGDFSKALRSLGTGLEATLPREEQLELFGPSEAEAEDSDDELDAGLDELDED